MIYPTIIHRFHYMNYGFINELCGRSFAEAFELVA